MLQSTKPDETLHIDLSLGFKFIFTSLSLLGLSYDRDHLLLDQYHISVWNSGPVKKQSVYKQTGRAVIYSSGKENAPEFRALTSPERRCSVAPSRLSYELPPSESFMGRAVTHCVRLSAGVAPEFWWGRWDGLFWGHRRWFTLINAQPRKFCYVFYRFVLLSFCW